jgi:TolB-like protein/Flp pilus assembly protein TadD
LAIIGLLVIAVIFMFVDNYVLNPEPEQVEVTAEQVPAAESTARENSIAVLPFVNMSNDPEQEYFADGIAEELLNTLASFNGLRVVGRTSSFSFRNSGDDLKTIGKALGAGVILEGSVRKAGDRVRITAQLVNTEDGYHRWSETYDRELTDIFAIQTEIAMAIADALRVSFSSEQRERLAASPTENLEAYQAYLLGRQRLAKGTTASVEEAIEYFQQAIELDPKLALAYVGLTQSYLAQSQSGLPPGEMIARAQAVANKALRLDDRLAEAHVALGQVEWFMNDFEAAEAAFQRALALNPNSVMAHLSYADLLGFELARYDEALVLTRKAVELDPLSLEATMQLAEHLNMLGRIDEALSWYERVLEIDPDDVRGYTQIGLHHRYVSGRIDEAVVWMTKALALDPRSQFNLAVLVWQFLDLGDPDRAEYWSNRCMELGSESYFPNVVMQMLAVYRGDDAAALEHGRKALALWPYDLNQVLTFLRNREVRAGRYIEARALYEELFPELLSERDPEVDLKNYRAAIDLALILSRTGEQEQADMLLDRSLQQIQHRPRFGRRGYDITDVQIYALQGEKQKALSALREAIDEGWRADWWWRLRRPDLESLHDEPEFQAMVEEIRADMAAQLERVREMERRGELAPIPPIGTSPAS